MGSPAAFAHGPGLIGTMLNVLLYGIMITQSFTYFQTYRSDKIWLKIYVALLLVADTVNTVFDIWWIYSVLIDNFDNAVALEKANWVFATDPAMVGVISTAVQFFFAWRVKVLTDSKWAVAVIIITAICSFCGALGTAIAIHIVPRFAEFQRFQVIVIIWLISTAICDATITFALTWYLRGHKTGFSPTDDILHKLMRSTVQTGLLTSIWATADLIAFLSSPSGLHLAFNFPLAKLYTNSLLSSLNSRKGWKYQTSESTGAKGGPNSEVVFGNRQHDVVHLSTHTRPEVYVHVESHEMADVVNAKGDMEWPGQASSKDTTTDDQKVSPVDEV